MPCTAAFTPEVIVPVLTAPKAVVDRLPIELLTDTMMFSIEQFTAEALLATFSTSAPVSGDSKAACSQFSD